MVDFKKRKFKLSETLSKEELKKVSDFRAGLKTRHGKKYVKKNS